MIGTVGEARLRSMRAEDVRSVVEVAASLPEWFNSDGIAQISDQVPTQSGAVVEVDGTVVGFVTWKTLDDEGAGEIAWIGVHPRHHRRGFGRRLLSAAEEDLGASGVREVFVVTLGEGVVYEPYERTRAFYRSAGFVDFTTEVTDNPGMPEALTLRKPLPPI